MKSLKKMAELADRFESKLSRAQQVTDGPATVESDQRPVIMDAFFGPMGEQMFLKQINQPTSNFNKAAGDVEGKISINVKVDAATKTAEFVVSPNLPKLKVALAQDYAAVFKADPQKKFQERLAKNDIKPPNVSGTTNLVTM